MSSINGNILIRIAVAEDHAMFREALCRQINDWENCKVILQAANGRELLDGLNRQNLPDLVLVDLGMPIMNGYETIKEMKRLYSDVKLLVVSMYKSEEAILQIIKAGAQGFVYKEEGTEKIKKAVHEMMRAGYFFSDHAASKMLRHSLQTGTLSLHNDLSDEQLVFLKYICTEKTYKAIAKEMCITGRHAEYLRYNLFERFDVQSRTGLAITATEKGLVV